MSKTLSINQRLSSSHKESNFHNSKNFLQKISLLKIPQLSTESILKDMNNEFKLITRRAHYNKKQFKSVDNEEENIISIDPSPYYEWDFFKEYCFKINRKSAKNLYNEEIKGSNFLDIAFLPLVQETYILEKKKKDRNLKLIKYAEGEWLSSEELKFLADTNALLNKCVDKKFLQDAVNIIDSEVINNLELYLAENIIMNYENLRNTIKKARLGYIKQFNDYKYDKIQQRAEECQKKEEIKRRYKENQKFKKTLENICIKMQKQGKFFSKEKEKKNIFAKMFIQKLKTNVKKKAEKNEMMLTKELLINRLPQSNTQKRTELKRRQYHPSSKLFLLDNKDLSDEEIKEEENQKNDTNYKEILKFNININSPIYYKNTYNFKKFYSGGPIVPMRTEPFWSPYDPKKPITVNSASELKKIITLQKYIRKYLAKKKLDALREEPTKQIKDSLKRLNNKKEMKLLKSFKTMIGLSNNKPNNNPNKIYTPVISRQLPFNNQIFAKSYNLKSITQQTKPSSILTSITKSTKNFSTQNSVISPDQNKRNSAETLNSVPGLLKHRKLLENAKVYSLESLKNLGFSYTKGDVGCRDENNNTPLFYAAERGLYDFCEFLIRLGANCNDVCFERNTPLHMAFKSGKINIMMLMLKYGGEINMRNKYGQTPKNMTNGKVLKELDLKQMITLNN